MCACVKLYKSYHRTRVRLCAYAWPCRFTLCERARAQQRERCDDDADDDAVRASIFRLDCLRGPNSLVFTGTAYRTIARERARAVLPVFHPVVVVVVVVIILPPSCAHHCVYLCIQFIYIHTHTNVYSHIYKYMRAFIPHMVCVLGVFWCIYYYYVTHTK